MSFQAMTWAVEQELPTNQKMVLLMLANRTNSDTGRCDPSHKRLAKDCGMSLSTLKRALSSLETDGFISVHTRKAGEVNLPNQYQLNLNRVGSERTDPSSERPEGVGSERATNQEVNNQEVKPVNQGAEETEKPKRKTALPKGFEPNQTCRQKASDLGVPIDLEIDKFCDFHQSKGNKYVDWQAAFRNWLAKAAEFRSKRGGNVADIYEHRQSLASQDVVIHGVKSRGRAIPSECNQPDDDGILTLPDGRKCHIDDWDAGRVTWGDQA